MFINGYTRLAFIHIITLDTFFYLLFSFLGIGKYEALNNECIKDNIKHQQWQNYYDLFDVVQYNSTEIR